MEKPKLWHQETHWKVYRAINMKNVMLPENTDKEGEI